MCSCVLFLDLPAGRSSSGAAEREPHQRPAPSDASVRERRRRAARAARAAAERAHPKVMAEEAKAADAPPPPPEDGEVAEANAAPQATEEGPHPLEHKWTLAAV